MPAIETLGAATVLCVDKTGTLTQNQMTVRALATDRASKFLDGSNGNLLAEDQFRELLETAVLASKPEPFDPMERAIHRVFKSTLSAHARHHPNYEMVHEYALTPELLAMTHVWRESKSNVVVIASKGAPEAIADLCQLSQEERARVRETMSSLAAKGLRVLGVASGEGCATDLPENQRGLKLRYVGLVAFEDPLRENVPAAVAECRSAGIRVVMITGDYPQTAQSIATQAGLSNPDAIITGPELAALSDDELTKRIRTAQVFARVVPEQKLRIVNALKANNEVVAMTGDGVNDAPALKAAHIGIAMGGRGTDVAREAASLVLLDDDFSSIVSAVKLGRRIFANIQKAIVFILAVHIPIAGLSMAPIFFTAWPLLLLPIHIVFLELIIDPSCSLIFEAEGAEPDTMQRPPRDRNERLFSQRTVTRALFQGLSVLVACLAVVVIAQPSHGANAARTLSFTTLVVSFVTIILANLSSGRSTLSSLHLANRALWWVVGGTSTLLVLVISMPTLRRLFYFDKPHLDDAVLSILAGIGCVLWFDLVSAKRRGKQLKIPQLR
jgi:Ca2+-transporting ATPase